MSDVEKYGTRDLTYSHWHRVSSTGRFLSDFEAWGLGMIDIDDVEYCRHCSEPLACIETAVDIGQASKCGKVTSRLAEKAGLPAYTVLYRVEGGDIVEFRVTLWEGLDSYETTTMQPPEYAEFLADLRRKHDCKKRKRA